MANLNICNIPSITQYNVVEFNTFNNMIRNKFGEGNWYYGHPILDVNKYFKLSINNWVVAVFYDLKDYPGLDDFQIAFMNIEDSVEFKLKYIYKI